MKTKLQIYRSAEQAALDSLTEPNNFATATFAMSRFTSENLDPRDWDYWNQTFVQQRQNFAQLGAMKSFSPLPATT